MVSLMEIAARRKIPVDGMVGEVVDLIKIPHIDYSQVIIRRVGKNYHVCDPFPKDGNRSFNPKNTANLYREEQK